MPYEDDYKMWLEKMLIKMNPDWICDEMTDKEFTHDWCERYCGKNSYYLTPQCLNMFYHYIIRADRKTEPQTEERQELEAYRKCIKSRSFWDAKHCDDCRFYDDCPFNEREEDALQTYCDTCKHDLWNNPEVCGKCVGSTTLGRNPRMYEPKTEPLDKDINVHEFYDCDRYVVTNDEGERAYNCIGCEQPTCAWK